MFTVRYGYDAARHRYVHSRHLTRLVAEQVADSFLASGGNGVPDELRVWVENRAGQVVHGRPAAPFEREES